jgi:AraC family transcriptional regulator, transcriptional activator of pobA
LKQITTLAEYCREINIAPPRHAFFDIRRFEDNMKTVNEKQKPFRHEFYAMALRHKGSNREVMGKPLQSNLFFNSPYQVVTWDIKPDWKGWYIIFDREFISSNPLWQQFIIEFPYFRLDKTIPFDLPIAQAAQAEDCFQEIFKEYHSDHQDKFRFIQNYTQTLLLLARRYFEQLDTTQTGSEENRAADVLLVSRFQTLVESFLTHEDDDADVRQPSYYAQQLHVHPNHLNAVVKRITNYTATQIIQQQLINMAQSLLRQTDLSAKEIAFKLHFNEPTHFNAFFKKITGQTPQQFRGQQRDH